MNGRTFRRSGFTLVELLLVLTIIGLALSLIIPRAMRAQTENKFSMVRQYGSEIAAAIMVWGQSQAKAQNPLTNFTLKDFLTDDITESDGAGLTSAKLADKYTGNDDFDGVERMMTGEALPRNPFNEASYFSRVNDDTDVPSKKAGLLYLATLPDPNVPEYLNFYLIFTANTPDIKGNYWFGDMDHRDPNKIRRGVFVARLFDDREYGGNEQALLNVTEEKTIRP